MNKIQLADYLEMTTDIWLDEYSKFNDGPLNDLLALLSKEEIISYTLMESIRCGKLVCSVWEIQPMEEELLERNKDYFFDALSR